jgi:hypothetical protein
MQTKASWTERWSEARGLIRVFSPVILITNERAVSNRALELAG